MDKQFTKLVYVDLIDDLEKNGKSISQVVELPDDINSKIIVSYDSISIDSDVPLVSDSDHQRIFPNSVNNMRKRIQTVGEREREFLPLWMRSIQETSTFELGFTKALVLCYTKPGKADSNYSKNQTKKRLISSLLTLLQIAIS